MRDSDGHSGDSSFRVIDCVSVDKVGMFRPVLPVIVHMGLLVPVLMRTNSGGGRKWLFSVEGMVRVLSVLLVLRRD